MAGEKKIILTGAEGQLGSDIALLLAERGLQLSAFGSRELDITDRRRVFEVIERERPALVINAAAYTKVDLAEKEAEKAFMVNRDGVKNIAEAAARAGASLVHFSTDFVFDGKKSSPYTEEDPTAPLGVYGRSKLEGEKAIAAALDRYVIIRTSWLYGSTGKNFVRTMLALGAERDVLRVVYDQTGSPTWTGDLAGAAVLFAERILGGETPWGLYHYADEGVGSWYDLAVAALEEARAIGSPIRCSRIEPILTKDYPTPAVRPAYSVLGKEKIKNTLGITIPHWRESLRRMLCELLAGRAACGTGREEG